MQLAQKERFGNLLTRYCSQCGYPKLLFQILCFECGMVATCESKTARSMISSEYLKIVERHAYESAAGPALRTEAASAAVADEPTSSWQTRDSTLERAIAVSDEQTEKTLAKLLEYGGTGLS